MALTATIRNLIMSLLALLLSLPAVQPVIELLAMIGFTITPEFLSAVSLTVAGFVSTFILGLVTYTVNKLGSKWGWINTIMSAGRSATSAAYVPRHAESIEVTVTPPGEQTTVTAESKSGVTTKVAI